jgi:hypothetical protein
MAKFINPSSFPDEDWVTSDKIMCFFSISKSTLSRWNKDQQIPRARIGGTNYYPKKFIQQYLFHKLQLPDKDEREQPGTPPDND